MLKQKTRQGPVTDPALIQRRRAALVELGVSQTAIAKAAGVTPQLVQAVLRGERQSPRVLQQLLVRLGYPLMKSLDFPIPVRMQASP